MPGARSTAILCCLLLASLLFAAFGPSSSQTCTTGSTQEACAIHHSPAAPKMRAFGPIIRQPALSGRHSASVILLHGLGDTANGALPDVLGANLSDARMMRLVNRTQAWHGALTMPRPTTTVQAGHLLALSSSSTTSNSFIPLHRPALCLSTWACPCLAGLTSPTSTSQDCKT